MDDDQIIGYVTIPKMLIPAVTPLQNLIPRAPMCRCSVLPIEGEYCNICENFPCLGGHPPVD